MTGPVLVLGDANVDLAIRLPRRESGGAARALTQPEPQLFGGGSAANAAVAAARLGLSVAFVGTVGDDGYGRWVRADLAGEGIDVSGMRARARRVHADGDRHDRSQRRAQHRGVAAARRRG